MPRPRKNPQNDTLLQAALEGLELQRQKIEESISQVRSMLGTGEKRRGRPPGKRTAKKTAASANGTGSRKPLSAAARKRIAAAQKRRWAAYRKSAAASGAGA